MKKYDCKKNIRGITLIALIITIIILLILAVTSITLIINQGILDKSKNATDSYSVSEMDEKVQLAYSEYNMTKINNPSYTFKDALTAAGITIDKDPEGNDDNGYTVTISGLEYKVKGLKDSTTTTTSTVYFELPNSWGDSTVYCWIWGKDSDENTINLSTTYPGETMEKVSGTSNVYSYTVPESNENISLYNKILFSNGDGDTAKKTIDLDLAYGKIFKVEEFSDTSKIRVFLRPRFNNVSYTKLYAYLWKDSENNNWPGAEMTKLSDDCYVYIFDKNKYNQIIFSIGDSSGQTNSLTVPSATDMTFTGGNDGATDSAWGYIYYDGNWYNY